MGALVYPNILANDTTADADQVMANFDEAASVINGNITAINLANDAVETDKIKDLAVTTPKLDDLAVTDAKFNDAAASKITVLDTLGIYTAAEVEAALAEVKTLADTNSSLIAAIDISIFGDEGDSTFDSEFDSFPSREIAQFTSFDVISGFPLSFTESKLILVNGNVNIQDNLLCNAINNGGTSSTTHSIGFSNGSLAHAWGQTGSIGSPWARGGIGGKSQDFNGAPAAPLSFEELKFLNPQILTVALTNAYADNFLRGPFGLHRGGAGGGAGGELSGGTSTGGFGGGGVTIIANGTITINATVSCNGGAGTQATPSGGGGGGGGGIVALGCSGALLIDTSGLVNVIGGAAAAGTTSSVGRWAAGGEGGWGAGGRGGRGGRAAGPSSVTTTDQGYGGGGGGGGGVVGLWSETSITLTGSISTAAGAGAAGADDGAAGGGGMAGDDFQYAPFSLRKAVFT